MKTRAVMENDHKFSIRWPIGASFFLMEQKQQELCCGRWIQLIWPSYKITQKNEVVSKAWIVQWYGFHFCRRISFASDTYGMDRTLSLAFSYCLVSMEHDLAHGGFSSVFQQNFPSLLVCNAWKREHSRKTAINFSSDGRLGPVFFCRNKNDKNYAVGGEFSWFDLPIKLHKIQRGF